MDDKTLGARIRQARETQGMTQEDLGDALGKDQKTISMYENGRRSISALDLFELARVLQTPITYFFDEDISPDQSLDDDMLYVFHQLSSQELREAILHVVRVLATASPT